MMYGAFHLLSGGMMYLLLICFLNPQTVATLPSSVLTDEDCPAPPSICFCGGNNNVITCTGHGLTVIPAFSKSNEVWDVYLKENKIKHIPDGAFKNLKISYLDLSSNSLENVSDLAFLGQENTLKSLHFEDNNLKAIPKAVLQLKNLTSLRIQGNPIATFDETIMKTLGRSLYTFHFGSKEMTTWPTSLRLLNTYEIGIYSLPLQQLPESAFEGLESTLSWLYLTSTDLHCLPSSFRKLYSLYTLAFDFDENLTLEGISEDFFIDFKGLHWLRMTNINLTKLPNIFHYVTGLSQLELYSVPISDMPADILPEHSNISIITFNDTLIRTVPSAISRMKKLAVLTLNYNNITTLRSDDIAGLTKLTYVSLSNCPLTNISLDAFRNLDSLKYIALDNTELDTIPRAIEGITFDIISLFGAPLICSCESMGWMKKWPDAGKIGINGNCRNLNHMDVSTYVRQFIPKCPN